MASRRKYWRGKSGLLISLYGLVSVLKLMERFLELRGYENEKDRHYCIIVNSF